ncbi:MAG: type 1 glutamine amidotransferase [Deltaproteobacteria bacterium]|nr:MAG: type 1 glutamine amidotransferase [Deltaproteobacteria bacterium]
MSLRFLIVDGYPPASREEFTACQSEQAWKLYADMLQAHLPEAGYDVLFPADPGSELPAGAALASYRGILWTGCNLTIYDQDDERVRRMIELQRQAYQQGVPAYGSCWGLQIAVVAAGGQVAKNPRGREMGLARKIVLTGQGRAHPFLRDKPPVFDAFISHYDEVTTLPPGAVLLAGNDFTRVQAAEVRHAAGTFWAVQYHPEYSLHDMARLIVARRQRLLDEGFFTDEIAFQTYVTDLETLHDQPERRDLRWRLGIDDDVLDPSRRQLEFRNWLERLVLPGGPR